MFSRETEKVIETLAYDAYAEIRACWLPLGGIYWSDELPKKLFFGFAKEDDRKVIMLLFGIRMSLWNGTVLDSDDEALWQGAQAAYPTWGLFRRLSLSKEERELQEPIEGETLGFFEAFDSLGEEPCDGNAEQESL